MGWDGKNSLNDTLEQPRAVVPARTEVGQVAGIVYRLEKPRYLWKGNFFFFFSSLFVTVQVFYAEKKSSIDDERNFFFLFFCKTIDFILLFQIFPEISEKLAHRRNWIKRS